MTTHARARLRLQATAEARASAVDLGVAIQLTNILRDVGSDVDLGRVYLPLADLEACGCDVQDVLERRLTPEYKQCVALQIARARELYASARDGAQTTLPDRARLPVFAIIELLSAIVDELERRDCDNLSSKVQPDFFAILSALGTALARSAKLAPN